MYDDDQDASLGPDEDVKTTEAAANPGDEPAAHDETVDRALRNISMLDSNEDAQDDEGIASGEIANAEVEQDAAPSVAADVAEVADEADATYETGEDAVADVTYEADAPEESPAPADAVSPFTLEVDLPEAQASVAQDAPQGSEPLPEDNAYDASDVETAGYEEVPEDSEAEAERNDDPFAAATETARSAGQQLKDGFEAFKSVHEASQRHLSARDTLRTMREQLDEHTAQLKHRIDIEQRYPQIVSEQTAEIEAATALANETLQRANTLESERADLESQLTIMKDRHEDQLRPYRNVAESTKGRADDAARALAEAKRATKNAEGNLAEATRRRDQRISQANRTVDTAQDRLRKLQAELETVQADGDAEPGAVVRLQNEIASVQAHLNAAVADVPAITEESRQSVESAQAKLFEQKKLQSQAERDAEAAKKEANARRSEYESLYKKSQEEERALSEQIKLHVTAAEQARKENSDAQARITKAQGILDEAEAIHSTPHDTIALRDQITHEQADFDHQQDEVDALAANEKALRRGTFKQRMILVLAGLAALALIVLIVSLFVIGGNKKQEAAPKQETQQTQVEADKKEKDQEKDKTTATDAKDEKTDSGSATGTSDKADSSSSTSDSSSASSSSSKTDSSSASGTAGKTNASGGATNASDDATGTIGNTGAISATSGTSSKNDDAVGKNKTTTDADDETAPSATLSASTDDAQTK